MKPTFEHRYERLMASADTLYRQGRFHEALRRCEAAERRATAGSLDGVAHARVRVQRGWLALAVADWSGAARLAQESLERLGRAERMPAVALEARLLLGRALHGDGRHPEARVVLEGATADVAPTADLVADGLLIEAHHWSGRSSTCMQEQDDAHKAYEAAVHLALDGEHYGPEMRRALYREAFDAAQSVGDDRLTVQAGVALLREMSGTETWEHERRWIRHAIDTIAQAGDEAVSEELDRLADNAARLFEAPEKRVEWQVGQDLHEYADHNSALEGRDVVLADSGELLGHFERAWSLFEAWQVADWLVAADKPLWYGGVITEPLLVPWVRVLVRVQQVTGPHSRRYQRFCEQAGMRFGQVGDQATAATLCSEGLKAWAGEESVLSLEYGRLANRRMLAGDYEGALNDLDAATEHGRRAGRESVLGRSPATRARVLLAMGKAAEAESLFRAVLEERRAENLSGISIAYTGADLAESLMAQGLVEGAKQALAETRVVTSASSATADAKQKESDTVYRLDAQFVRARVASRLGIPEAGDALVGTLEELAVLHGSSDTKWAEVQVELVAFRLETEGPTRELLADAISAFRVMRRGWLSEHRDVRRAREVMRAVASALTSRGEGA